MSHIENLIELIGLSPNLADDAQLIIARIRDAALAAAWGKDRTAYEDIHTWADAVLADLAYPMADGADYIDIAIGDEIRLTMQADLDRKRNAGDLISRTLGQ